MRAFWTSARSSGTAVEAVIERAAERLQTASGVRSRLADSACTEAAQKSFELHRDFEEMRTAGRLVAAFGAV